MTMVQHSGCAGQAQKRKRFMDASGANLAIRSRVAELSFGREVFESESLPVGGKQIRY